MGVFDLFSKRQKRLRGEVPDVYQYTDLPNAFRTQVVHILSDLFGDPNARYGTTLQWFKLIHDTLCREYGRFRLSERTRDARSDVFEFLGSTANAEEALDVIELAFKVAPYAHKTDDNLRIHSKPTITPVAAVEELNVRFREHGIGFQFEGKEIVRVDSQVLHEEAVKPALHVLKDKRFAGANDEFLKAHEHYRHQRYSEAINECLKAFESTLKVICKTQDWPFKETDTAKALLDIVFAQGLIPVFLQSEFTGLRSVLESGVPTTRSRMSAHGAGAIPKQVPQHLASYVLHLTASSILFLAEAEKRMP